MLEPVLPTIMVCFTCLICAPVAMAAFFFFIESEEA